MEKLTKEQIQDKANDLSTKEGCKVYPFAFLTDDDSQVVGYFKEPSRIAKMSAFDAMAKTGFTAAGEIILTSSLIVDASDSRILSPLPENDAIFLTACIEAAQFVKVLQSDLKKN